MIYADPEWQFEPRSRDTGLDRAADNHYPTSPTGRIAARPVAGIAAADCVLFLWATAPMLPQALAVLAAWGFAYKSHFIWKKVRPGGPQEAGSAGGATGKRFVGTGYWNRSEHELLLVGTRGSPPCPAPGKQWGSVINAPVGRHSEKPGQFAQLIEAYFPSLPKIELNARAARPGWDAWGDEVGFVEGGDAAGPEEAPSSPGTGEGDHAEHGGRGPLVEGLDADRSTQLGSIRVGIPDGAKSETSGFGCGEGYRVSSGDDPGSEPGAGLDIPNFLRRGHEDCVVRG